MTFQTRTESGSGVFNHADPHAKVAKAAKEEIGQTLADQKVCGTTVESPYSRSSRPNWGR